MGKGRPRAVEKGVLGQNPSTSPSGNLIIPQAPVYYPTEDEFSDPLEFIEKIRSEAESYGICRIVPPKSWKPPFALDLEKFTFPTKSQEIHRLQVRAAACDPQTFELEYNRFLEDHCGRKPKKRSILFQGEELDLCKLFNAVKRYGGYDKVVREKKWGDVSRFVRSGKKISECAKHVLCQLYREHLYDYEEYHNQLSHGTRVKKCKRGRWDRRNVEGVVRPDSKRRRKNMEGENRKARKLEVEEELDQICEQCKSGLHGEVMLLCDRCNKGWHLYCLSPPLECVPAGNWYCLECVNSDKECFGFVPGKCFSLEAFRRLADRAKRKWFGAVPATRSQIEKLFWEIVEGSLGEVDVMYGSDLDTSLVGSGFPRSGDPLPSSIEPDVWMKYSASPWNLNNLPKLQGSMLRTVHDNIAGVMVPWLYVGMLFSSFCWHFEDHCFYSMNYLHWGEPKCWYSVPGGEAQAFEKVMRNTLPDLFDAQPDLLFQLVTMLNPSVLQESGVPVYGVLQEPGNFVITFPRSFHGGFNFGFNCAEAVNFAPADWLPHGGFGAELYRLYRKPAVLSHEELLCVVAKGNWDKKVLPYLRDEIIRIFTKEKTCREKLWRNGTVKSSPMSPRKHPEHVGTEEDPTCIICRQYLYLSAVVCSCRPSAYVCLEHWKHLCECTPSKHRLLYRHTLAELNDLLTAVSELEKCQIFCSNESNALMKKVKGGYASHVQLAEDWVATSHHIMSNPFSDDACNGLLSQAEQFLWAGHEMDQVRQMVNKLIETRKWAVEVRNCLFKVDTCLHHQSDEKLSLSDVEKLLGFDPLPCNEPGHSKLKAYVEDARMLLVEINSALSSSSGVMITQLEILLSRAGNLPIYLEESKKLAREIDSAQVWMGSVRKCFSVKKPAMVELDILNKLNLEMGELCVKLPESDMLLDMLRQVESWKTRCSKVLEGPITLKELEALLQDAEDFNVSIPELRLLRQYYSDTLSWICRAHDVLASIQKREDYSNIVGELTCILNDGDLLRVQVEELTLVERELRKSCCREKAFKALTVQMPLEFIQELITEASLLQIAHEKIFIDISQVFAAAVSWEERAKNVLYNMGQMSEFEDVMRVSTKISVILPSLSDVKNALSIAESWIRRSQPFLISTVSCGRSSSPLLKSDTLKDLVSQSKLLRVSLKAPEMLWNILNDVEAWERDACSLLETADSFYNMYDADFTLDCNLTTRIEELLSRIKCASEAGQSLGFDFCELPKLRSASLTLEWSFKALSLFSAPSHKEVRSLIEDVEHLPASYGSNFLLSTLIEGARWLGKALLVISECHNPRRCKLNDIEEVLQEHQRIKFQFPVMVTQLVEAIEKHKYWQDEVRAFFNSSSEQQTWSSLLQLKELGESDALDSPELDKVNSEIARVDKWLIRCKDIVGSSFGESGSLSNCLAKIKETLDTSLSIYMNSDDYRARSLCLWCSNDCEDEVLACLTCEDRYHISCTRLLLANAGMSKAYACPYCLYLKTGAISKDSRLALISRRMRPELEMFIELLLDSKDLYSGVQERDMVQELVERALACRSFLIDTVKQVLAYLEKDLVSMSRILLLAVKAIAVAGVYDHKHSCILESALTRHSWKIRAKNLLESSTKPCIQQIQRLLKEGVAINVPSEDHFMRELADVKHITLQWANHAKKVALDSGEHELDEVFKLIAEGENLPIHFEKELKLLRARSVLYCICRKPYDQRPMIACDQCDEWYHFNCINLHEPPPKTFICPACKPLTEESVLVSPSINHEERSSIHGEPQTPPPQHSESKRRRIRKARSSLQHKMLFATDLINLLRCSSESDNLWRKSRRPFRRTARKRCKFESFSPFLH